MVKPAVLTAIAKDPARTLTTLTTYLQEISPKTNSKNVLATLTTLTTLTTYLQRTKLESSFMDTFVNWSLVGFGDCLVGFVDSLVGSVDCLVWFVSCLVWFVCY